MRMLFGPTLGMFLGALAIPSFAIEPIRTTAELVAAVKIASEGDTIELAAGKFELDATMELKGGMTLKGAGIDKTTLTSAKSWKPSTNTLPDPEMKLEGLDTDAYLIRVQRDTSGVTISEMTLHGPQLHGAIFNWFPTDLHLHQLRIKETLWCGVRTRQQRAAADDEVAEVDVRANRELTRAQPVERLLDDRFGANCVAFIPHAKRALVLMALEAETNEIDTLFAR